MYQYILQVVLLSLYYVYHIFFKFLLHYQIYNDLSRMKRFNAQEALEYGLIDRIVRPPRIKADAVSRNAGTGLG